MLNRYRAAFAAPGAAAFSTAGFVSRLPIAIYPIAIVLIVSARTHSYGYAGVISGSYVIGGAFGNPAAGILVDRFGQHRMLPRFLLGHLVAAGVFAVLLTVRAPLWTLLVPALLMGVTLLNIGALIRARWSRLWADDPAQRSTAYSVESTLDEVIFVIGPLVATVLATHSPPLVTLGLAIVLVGLGSLWLASQRRTEPPVRAREAGERHDFALRYRGMQLITWVMVFMGAVFGSAEVVMVAFCGQHGQRSSAGWVIACFAGGSGLAGIGYGARHWRTPLLRRFVFSALVFGVLPLLYFVASSVPVLAVCTGLVGLGIAPTLIGGFGLVDSIVPTTSLTEGLTWIGTGLSVGYGFGASVVGEIADRHGAHLAFSVPVGCALAAAACALLLAARMRTAQPVALVLQD
ncbi:MAG: MFS transporter [Actinomycetota bacterium]|nr:MFS transporter [Actinomycetota bacterium]MDQ2955739.1 MFS transporter [Actinomycetota bacterium]